MCNCKRRKNQPIEKPGKPDEAPEKEKEKEDEKLHS